MKRSAWLVMMVLALVACNNSGRAEVKTDSLKRELDTTLGKVKDSVKAKGERTLDAVKEKLEDLKRKNENTEKDTAK